MTMVLPDRRLAMAEDMVRIEEEEVVKRGWSMIGNRDVAGAVKRVWLKRRREVVELAYLAGANVLNVMVGRLALLMGRERARVVLGAMGKEQRREDDM